MIYLNNAATSFPKPESVNEAVRECLTQPPCHSSRTGIESDSDDVDFACRHNLAKIFNADDPLKIVFTSGSTEALNLAVKGLGIEGSHVVSTQIEHNSVIRPLKTMEEKGEIELDFVKCDERAYVRPSDIENAIRENTSTVVVNHCSNVTGTVLDLEEISKIAHAHGCKIIVDASQSAGVIPIDVEKWEIDYLAFTGHKSLYGLQGIGGLYMRKTFELEPLKTGGTGVKSEVLTQPREMTMYYEAGTANTSGIVSLKAGTDFVLETGIENIQAHKKKIYDTIYYELAGLPEISVYNHPEHTAYSHFTFNIKNMVPEEVNYALESSYDIHVRSGLHCAPLLLESLGVDPWGTVRASASYFTTEDEVGAFIDAIKDIIKTFVR